MYLPYNEKFVTGSEEDMYKLIEAGFDIQNIRKTRRGVCYLVKDVATCVIEMTSEKVVFMCSDKHCRRFLLTDKSGKHNEIEVDKEPYQGPPLTREKPSAPGWYKRISKTGEFLEFDYVKVDLEQETNELKVWTVDGASDYLDNVEDRFVWGSKPERTSFF